MKNIISNIKIALNYIMKRSLNNESKKDKLASINETEMINNVIKARGLNADDVMVPRADMVCLAKNFSLETIIETINKAPHTRYAVSGEDTDDILGMIHIKDVLTAFSKISNGEAKKFDIKDIIRPVIFVAPSMGAMDLLLSLRVEGVHLAIVVDEHGGTDGQINLEDLVEEVIGDIRDELDSSIEPTCETMPDGSYIVDGRYDLEELQALMDIVWQDNNTEDIDTVGGFVMALAGRMPIVGEVIHHEPTQLEFHITDADPRRISRLRIVNKKIEYTKNK